MLDEPTNHLDLDAVFLSESLNGFFSVGAESEPWEFHNSAILKRSRIEVLWLDNYLSEQYPHAVVVVSHDADFLDSICSLTAHGGHDRSVAPKQHIVSQDILSKSHSVACSPSSGRKSSSKQIANSFCFQKLGPEGVKSNLTSLVLFDSHPPPGCPWCFVHLTRQTLSRESPSL